MIRCCSSSVRIFPLISASIDRLQHPGVIRGGGAAVTAAHTARPIHPARITVPNAQEREYADHLLCESIRFPADAPERVRAASSDAVGEGTGGRAGRPRAKLPARGRGGQAQRSLAPGPRPAIRSLHQPRRVTPGAIGTPQRYHPATFPLLRHHYARPSSAPRRPHPACASLRADGPTAEGEQQLVRCLNQKQGRNIEGRRREERCCKRSPVPGVRALFGTEQHR